LYAFRVDSYKGTPERFERKKERKKESESWEATKRDTVPEAITGHSVPGGLKYRDLALQVGGVWNLRQQNVAMSPAELSKHVY
jgi:hypothetical protein